MNRSSWHMRANALVGLWLIAAAIIAIVHRFVPENTWLMIHLVLLGAVSTAILIWSQHFAQTLLRSPNLAGRRGEAIRLAIHTLGALSVIAGMVGGIWPLVVVGGILVGGNAIWHAGAIMGRKRRALPARFSHLVRYYLVATLILPIGVAMGVWLARGAGALSAAEHSRVYVSHVTLNLLGWVGITVLGTLVTLWPTALRTQLHERAEKQARWALPILVAGIAVIQIAALTTIIWLVPLGVALYLVGMALIYVPALATGWRKRPRSFATLSLAASGIWLAGSVVAFAIFSVIGGSWGEIADSLNSLAVPFVVGFGAQVLLGALSYLLPVVLGGGPKMSRRTTEIMDGGGPARVLLVNVGLVVCLAPVPSLVRVAVSLVVFGALVAFLPKALRAVRTARRGVEALAADESDERPAGVGNARGNSLGSIIAATSVLVMAVAIGVAGDPAAVGLGASANDDSVVATGEVTEIEVEMRDMRFWPASVDVAAGNQLIITVVNTDDDVHDLVLDTGDSTGRVAPGDRKTIDVGVVGRSIDGWCSVAGHRQMGMVFDINVIGGAESGENVAGTGDGRDTGDAGGAGSTGHGAANHGAGEPGASDESAAADVDLMAEPGAGFERFDPVLAPAEDGAGPITHKVTLEVTEEVVEVAPGVKQTVWQFGGSAPGPTLRGKVGDIFEITLVNDGSLGHSIDFHAGMLAPNMPMRTIAPGETLTYVFTAEHSGIWMYHCSTVPMSLHIANGMFGAVIIDPPDLDEVDREFIMIQSEFYLGPQGEVADLAKIQADTPDLVAFNGYANQYVYEPVEVGVHDRVRIWVLPVGPNRGTSFHVIGGQFDTVFHEGAYRLRAGETTGASQALGLSTAQGGFVELTFPEIGDYPFVDHVMINAERGAKGLFAVR